MAKRDLALDLFHSFQTGKRSTRKPLQENSTTPEVTASGPHLLKDVLSQIVKDRDWKGGIAEGTLFSTWSEIVGTEIGLHTTPISLLEGVLTIQTTSTAWAVQLRLVSSELLTTIRASSPGALVESLAFIGPHGPSWKKGIRTIRGAKGPRDTYG